MFPIVFGFLLTVTAGVATSNLLMVGAPLVVASMSLETTLIDALLMHVVLKMPAKNRAVLLWLANAFNAGIALACIFAWRVYHPIEFIALVESWRQ